MWALKENISYFGIKWLGPARYVDVVTKSLQLIGRKIQRNLFKTLPF
jgi:hypothetical protein